MRMPGIMGMSFVAETKQGERYVVSALANNPEAEIDQPGFITLMTRLLDQLAERSDRTVLDLTDFKRDISELTDRLGQAQDCL